MKERMLMNVRRTVGLSIITALFLTMCGLASRKDPDWLFGTVVDISSESGTRQTVWTYTIKGVDGTYVAREAFFRPMTNTVGTGLHYYTIGDGLLSVQTEVTDKKGNLRYSKRQLEIIKFTPFARANKPTESPCLPSGFDRRGFPCVPPAQ
jgi:hypothetical protein